MQQNNSADLVSQFLLSGGEIRKCPAGKASDDSRFNKRRAELAAKNKVGAE